MITNVSLVSVWVKDLDESLAFYTDVLGFAAGDDIVLGEDFRWVTVTHPAQPELSLHLTTPSKPLSDDLIAAMQRAQSEGGLRALGSMSTTAARRWTRSRPRGGCSCRSPRTGPTESRP